MDRLPAETLSQIVSLLKALQEKHNMPRRSRPASYGSIPSSARLASYATINRTWQEVIERETFRSLDIDSDELPELAAMFSGATGDHRIRSLRKLGYIHLRNPVRPLFPKQTGSWKSWNDWQTSPFLKI